MLTNNDLLDAFARNRAVIDRQCDGLDNADSLIQPPFTANCLNWTVGHIVVHRDKALTAIGAEPVLDDAARDRYGNESNPITADGPDVVDLERLLAQLGETQSRLARTLPDVDLGREITVRDRQTTLAKRVHFWYFHDTYHTGQTELLRALAGRTDKVI